MARGISAQEAIALAKSGDADAQYLLSSALHERGQFEESLHWLRLAAAQGLVPARMALASFLMDGRHCPRDGRQAVDLLEPLAATQVQANLLLGELHGFAALGIGDRESGLRHLLAAARMGDGGALRQLALLGACHGRRDLLPALLDAASRRGDAAAIHLLARHPAGMTAGAPAPDIEWVLLEQALPQLAGDMPLPAAETLHAAPLIRMLPGAFPPLLLDWLIHRATPLVQRSQIVDAVTGEVRADPMRTSSHITFGPRQHDHVLEAIERCIGRVTGLPVANSEFLQILRYRPGEEFRPHVDYFNESGGGAYKSLAEGGQRAQTVLVYLNDDYSGGSTAFPRLQLDIKARRGDMLHFHNLGADGLGDRDTLHAGVPVTTGEKWLLSQWIRSESYRDRLAW
ncbi:MAG TPA: 2OG-Fe(II) oxygenase [Xanthomonadaceae bacterium]|jgi:prolyl 4-hydroxylase